MATTLTHWLLPAAAAALPWNAGFRLLSRASASDRTAVAGEGDAWRTARRFGYGGAPGETELSAAASRGGADGKLVWARSTRLMHLVDHADLFLSLTRSNAWLDRHVRVVGEWPRQGPFLALTYHWGAGLWSLRHLARAGHRARFLVRPIDSSEFGGDRWLARYAHLRIRAIERAMGQPLLYTGASSGQIDAALDAGTTIVGGCDVPTPAGRSSVVAALGERRIRMPLGVLRIACERGVPVVPFAVGVERSTGKRFLEIGAELRSADPQEIGAALAARLHDLLQRDPVAWTLWPFADALFVDAPAPG